MIDFCSVQKPQRYVGNEHNVIKKLHHKEQIKICFSYPDLYEVGMSNLGLRIIYGLLNEYNDVVCERVFMPGLDMVAALKQRREKLFSLETKTSLDKFEVLAFHLGCELNFTNFLNILELSGVKLLAKERKDIIVIGGGIANPEPLAEFVDVFYLGEFEQVAEEFVKTLRNYKTKQERLQALSAIEGFYVPKFYSVTLENGEYQVSKTNSFAQLPIRRAYLKKLDGAYYPTKWLTPHTTIIHDRAQIEIARGCPNRCTFCQARSLYSPYRQRSPQEVIRLAKEIYKSSGYQDFSLLCLSASNYSKIEELIKLFHDYFKDKCIGLSLPSLRIDDILGSLYKQLLLIKRTSLTVALETASPSLGKKLNKKIDINKLFEAAKIIKTFKLKQLKIYFMFGFSEEDDADLMAIGEFLKQFLTQTNISLNASINAFLPKPFSLWEDQPMLEESELMRRKSIVLKSIPKSKRIKFSISASKRNTLEVILSRADRSFAKVIYQAFKAGAKFDGYYEHFDWNTWAKAMAFVGFNYQAYLQERRKNFPWSFIESNPVAKDKKLCKLRNSL